LENLFFGVKSMSFKDFLKGYPLIIGSAGTGWPLSTGSIKYELINGVLALIPNYQWQNLLVALTAKTLTLLLRPGNMNLNQRGIPVEETLPDWLQILPATFSMVNQASLSNPSLAWYLTVLQSYLSQYKISQPLIISVAAISDDKAYRQREYIAIVNYLRNFFESVKKLPSKVGIEVNVSCPNVGSHSQFDYEEELKIILTYFQDLRERGVYLILKVGYSFPIDLLVKHQAKFDCVAFLNSSRSDSSEMQSIFSHEELPFQGGVSGGLMWPVLLTYLPQILQSEYTGDMIVGGGVLDLRQVEHIKVIFAQYKKLRQWVGVSIVSGTFFKTGSQISVFANEVKRVLNS
jgi:hypothetical protein